MIIKNKRKSYCIDNDNVFEFVNSVFGESMHLKRVESLANAALGLLHSEELILHKIGEGLAFAKELDKKHATKQGASLRANCVGGKRKHRAHGLYNAVNSYLSLYTEKATILE